MSGYAVLVILNLRPLQEGVEPIASLFLNICDGNKHAGPGMRRYLKLSVPDLCRSRFLCGQK